MGNGRAMASTYLSAADKSGCGSTIGYGTGISFPNISNALGEIGNAGMVSGCHATPGCVPYIGISYKSATEKAGLGESQLKNASGRYELPSARTINAEATSFTSMTPADEAISMIFGKAPTGYPIINYEYAVVPGKEQGADDSPGRQVAPPVGGRAVRW